MEILRSFIIGANDRSTALNRLGIILLGDDFAMNGTVSHQVGNDFDFELGLSYSDATVSVYVTNHNNGYFRCDLLIEPKS